MKLIDSHCHLHDTEFFHDAREEVYRRSIEAGVAMILVGTDMRSSREAVEFALTHDHTWAVVGVHPHETKHGIDGLEELITETKKINSSKLVGIGEIGLDYFYMHSDRSTQIKAFEGQLALAEKYHLSISFHVRDAFDDFWPIFDNSPSLRGVLHSFTDNHENLERGLSRGLSVGVNGISTFTKDQDQKKMYGNIPLERLLLETDAPFLTPAPFRGTMNEPGLVVRVAMHQAEMRNLSVSDIYSTTKANTIQLFSLTSEE